MSRPTFLTTTSSFEVNETPSLSSTSNTNPDHTRALRFHHRLMPTISTSSRSNETLPVVVVQSSSTIDSTTTTTNTTQRQSVVRINPKIKRNLRGKRRSTGIRPEEVTLASASIDMAFNEDNQEEDNNTNTARSQFITITNPEPSESFDPNRNSPPKPVFKVSRVQPTFDENSHRSFEKLSINRTDPYVMTSSSSSSIFPNSTPQIFRPEEFILRRQASSDDDPLSIKRRQYEERIRTLESLVYDKDAIIHDLQRKLEKVTRDLYDAEQQIYILQRDKLTLIKTLTTLQESKPTSPGTGAGGGEPSTSSKRTGFIKRN